MDYNRCLIELRTQLQEVSSDRLNEFATYEARLRSLVSDEHHFGSNETIRAELARVLAELNRLALETVGVSFNELCEETSSNEKRRFRKQTERRVIRIFGIPAITIEITKTVELAMYFVLVGIIVITLATILLIRGKYIPNPFISTPIPIVIAPTSPLRTAVPDNQQPTIAPSPSTGGGEVTPPPATSIFFDFEKDIQGWDTTERDFKLAELTITGTVKHTGQKALALTTELYGPSSAFAATNKDSVYQHTETKVYFTQAAQYGMNIANQYDMTSKQVSCWAYIPKEILPASGPTGKVGMFVKDLQSRNDYSEQLVNINADTTGTWIKVFLDVGRGIMDTGFDKTQVNNFGVKFETFANSAIAYKGPLYIDECAISDSPK